MSETHGIPEAWLHLQEADPAPPPWRRARTAFVFEETVSRLVALLKYSDRQDVAPFLAIQMIRAAADLIHSNDLVLPVPLHPHRLLARRFNQAALLSARIAAATTIPHAPRLLFRHRRAPRQVGLGREERKANMNNAFAVPERCRAHLVGRRVILVDDVLTTGATAEAATRALLKAGAASVDLLTAARVVRTPD